MQLLVYNTLTVPCKKSGIDSFVSSIMKNIVVSPAWFTFLVKLICYIDSGSASSAFSLLKSCCNQPIVFFKVCKIN